MRNSPLRNTSSPTVAHSTLPVPVSTMTESTAERFVEISESEARSLSAHINYAGEMEEILLRLYPEIRRKNPELAARIWSLTQECSFSLGIAFIKIRARLKEAGERAARRNDQGGNHA